jgi:hypothetical protein
MDSDTSHPIAPAREKLLRDYAAGEISCSILRQKGFANYFDVLAGLGELGLRPPVAPMDGPNMESRTRGRALLPAPVATAGETVSEDFHLIVTDRSPLITLAVTVDT